MGLELRAEGQRHSHADLGVQLVKTKVGAQASGRTTRPCRPSAEGWRADSIL